MNVPHAAGALVSKSLNGVLNKRFKLGGMPDLALPEIWVVLADGSDLMAKVLCFSDGIWVDFYRATVALPMRNTIHEYADPNFQDKIAEEIKQWLVQEWQD